MKISATDSALSAIQANFQRLDQSASQIARLGIDSGSASAGAVDSLTHEAVQQLSLKHNTEAQVQVLRSQDEMLGNLFDALA